MRTRIKLATRGITNIASLSTHCTHASSYSFDCFKKKGHHYRTSNLRYGPQCLNVIQNNLSEEDTSGCSDTDDAEVSVTSASMDMHVCMCHTHMRKFSGFLLQGTCEGCRNHAVLKGCTAYQCGRRHMFCHDCCHQHRCPCDHYPRRPGH